MNRRWLIAQLAATACLAGSAASAAVLEYSFQAQVTSTYGVPGVFIGAQVTGVFSIEADTINVGTSTQAIYLQPATTTFQFRMAAIDQDFGQVGRVEINDNLGGFDRYLACSQRSLRSADLEDACVYLLGGSLDAITDTGNPLPPTALAEFSLVALDYRLFQDGNLIGFVRANPLALLPTNVPEPVGFSLLLSILLPVHYARRQRRAS